jgi:hypothetical protein
VVVVVVVGHHQAMVGSSDVPVVFLCCCCNELSFDAAPAGALSGDYGFGATLALFALCDL